MHFHRRTMAKLIYLVRLAWTFRAKGLPVPVPYIYGYTWSLEKEARTYCIHIVCMCRFLKTEKITYYIDILHGFSVKTKQHIKLIIILRVS